MSNSNYNFLDRLLHRLALQYNFIAEMSFDIDQKIVPVDQREINQQQHVFISGLARAGTTVLMRRFHSTGLYRSLTYRDMPFILAPNLWQRLSFISKRELKNAERAHGDNLQVNADSPESLDEVFWRVFAGKEYIKKTNLIAHEPSTDVIHKYINYVNAILSTQIPRCDRYLSKNNNNILRLGSIHKAFPNALILIPFRDPLQHAHSLFRQHRHFSALQTDSEFTLSYMTWLSHHEFGLDHRPFQFGSKQTSPYSPDSLDYWLQVWCQTYEWLERTKPESALFVCYEDLCEDETVWRKLATLADISPHPDEGDQFKLSNRPVELTFGQELADRASAIYNNLLKQARSQLSD